ncbi:phosphotransferase-like protein [Cellulomonas biazotea]|uniref:Chloramphenicol phosphotransferase n=1 Tax=Cellulomonas biazotea TaxID=1709 RepID=A0A402DQM4_9CELL|nr:hypothetical protein [Cellulomonas biazotea]GCE76408.1 hypothetical protein CBZ_14640 [Cellulomonas biazotea]
MRPSCLPAATSPDTAAVAQAETVHRGVRYDLEVDTSVASPDECARTILTALAAR